MTDPFRRLPRGLADVDPVHQALRRAGSLVRVEAPAGGPVHVVTDDALARQVLADPRIVKDPAWAPRTWDPAIAGLEAPAAVALSLTTADGPAHDVLRRAHVPLFAAARMQSHAGRAREVARTLLGSYRGEVDLMADFTTRYSLTVLFEILGVPLELLDDAAAACRAMFDPDPRRRGQAIGELVGISGAALGRPGVASELRERLPELTDDEVRYLLFGLVFAGQLTTDTVLGFIVAHAVTEPPADADAFVREILRTHPPAPFTLWRFTACEVELAGVTLPPRTPLLVDIEGINEGVSGPDLTFGAGPHLCIGAQLARVELVAVVEVLASDFPDARVAVPLDELRQVRAADVQQGARLDRLPVRVRPGAE
jgi:cytochrome P450